MGRAARAAGRASRAGALGRRARRRSCGPGPRVAYSRSATSRAVEPARGTRRGGDCATRADRRLRPLRLLPADVPDLRALARGDGLAARPDPPDGGLVDGTIPLTDTVVEHFDRCLGCMACVHRLPVGREVRPPDRADARLRRGAPPPRRAGERLLRALIFARVPASPAPPRRARASAGCRRRRRSRRWPRRSAVGQHEPGRPSTCPGDGPRVAVLAGCVQSVVFGDVNAATARVLAADGYDVHVPRAQGCCGALHAHAGRLGRGRRARATSSRGRSSGYDRDRHERRRLRLASEGPRRRERRRRLGAARRAAAPAERQPLAAPRRVPGLVPPAARAARSSASRARRSARSPGSSCSSPPSRRSAAAAPASTTSSQPDAARELGDRKATARARDRRRRLRERQPRVPRAGHGGAPPGRHGRCPRSIRSSSSTRRSAAWTAAELLAGARR